MDPLSILSVAGTVIQLLDFSSKLVSKGYKIYDSADGLLIDYADLATAASHLLELDESLRASLSQATRQGAQSPADQRLLELCGRSSGVAKELIAALEQLRLRGRRTRWKSVRQAFKSIHGQARINTLKARLDAYRGVLDTGLLVSLKQNSIRGTWHNATSSFGKSEARTAWAHELSTIVDSTTFPAPDQPARVDLQRFSQQLAILTKRESRKLLTERIVQSLGFEDKEEREFRICDAHRETFKWAYGPPPNDGSRSWSDLAAWLESDDKLYWITGKAGSGKSTLMKFLSTNRKTFRHLRKWSGTTPLVVAKYYFWNSGSVQQMSQEGLLRSLLLDIFSHNLHGLIPKAFPHRWRVASVLGHDSRPWTLQELLKGFLAVLEYSHLFKLCLFIDGLDEFDGNHEHLLGLLRDVVSRPNIKACLSSRPWNVFEDALSQEPNLQLHHLTYPDVIRFVSSLLRANRFFCRMEQHDPTHSIALIDSVATRAVGVFLWVDLAVTSLLSGLSNCDRLSELQQRLDTIPPDLEKFYEKMLDSIEEFYLEHACQLFLLVSEGQGELSVLGLSFADEEDHYALLAKPTRPLSPLQIQDRCDVVKRRLNNCCKGLLEIPAPLQSQETQNLKVTYLHRTARDFLNSDQTAKRIKSGVKLAFSAAHALFMSSILSLKTFPGPIVNGNKTELWKIIDRTMQYAAKCESTTGSPQTQLLKEVDNLVTTLTKCHRSNHNCGDRVSMTDNEQHWTSGERAGRGANQFVDFASEYNLPSYMLQTIRMALPESVEDDPDVHTCLFHVVRDYRHHAGLCEWAGSRIPRVSFVKFLLEIGASPNKAINGATSFEIVLSEAVNASSDPSIVEKKRTLESWAIIIELFVQHDADPRSNVNSAMGSAIREALAAHIPITSKRLEKLVRKSKSKWTTMGKYLLRPLSGRDLAEDDEFMPLPVYNRIVSAQEEMTPHDAFMHRDGTKPPPRGELSRDQVMQYWDVEKDFSSTRTDFGLFLRCPTLASGTSLLSPPNVHLDTIPASVDQSLSWDSNDLFSQDPEISDFARCIQQHPIDLDSSSDIDFDFSFASIQAPEIQSARHSPSMHSHHASNQLPSRLITTPSPHAPTHPALDKVASSRLSDVTNAEQSLLPLPKQRRPPVLRDSLHRPEDPRGPHDTSTGLHGATRTLSGGEVASRLDTSATHGTGKGDAANSPGEKTRMLLLPLKLHNREKAKSSQMDPFERIQLARTLKRRKGEPQLQKVLMEES